MCIRDSYESVEIIFVGYGIDDPAYSDYVNIDVKNKIVVAIGGEPLDENENYFINGNSKSKWSNSREEINLKKSIALAVVKNGKKLKGKKLYVPMPNKTIEVIVSDTIFLDKEGKRLNA